ncbi:TolC family protein [Ferrimonas sediminicola]|uniref:TolC family protein n=1 Tax=Ferrimonas sediminicola TaxID=2569538 RepID=A0A4U1BIQ1_9GAMM|nr:TolC family protein [Ferrimonas sediminicola]TKB51223.1 TolC family protein [Ferrimonas sediminicola]
MRYWICALLCFSGTLSAQPLSLQQAWQRVEAVSDKLQAQQQAHQRAEAELGVANQLGDPSLTLRGSYLRLDRAVQLDARAINPLPQMLTLLPPGLLPPLPDSAWKTEISDRDIYHASLQAVWPLYVGGRIEAAKSIKAAEVEQQKQQTRLDTQERFSSLVERYFALALTHRVEQLHLARLDTLKRQLANAEALRHQGQIAEVERLDAQVALEQGQVALSQASRRRVLAQMALDTLLQRQGTELSQSLLLPRQMPDLDQWHRQMLATHPALALFGAKEAQAQGAINAERGRYKPELALVGNYSFDVDESLMSELEPEWMVGLTLKVPLVTNDGRNDRVRAAKSAQLQVQHLKAQTRQDLELLMASREQQLSQARHEYLALASAESLAKENLRLRQLAFAQGLGTSIDQVEAGDKLLEVQTARAAAQYRCLVALGQLAAMSDNQSLLFQLLKSTEIQ